MNCSEFELIGLALARNQLMDAVAHELGLAHAESCERCAGWLASERFLIAGTRAVVAELATEEAPAHVEVALLAAFREQVVAVTSPSVLPMPVNTSSRSFWRPVAVAASILFLISTMAVFWSYSNLLNESNEELAILPATVDLTATLAVPLKRQDDVANPLANSHAQDRSRQRVSRRRSNQVEMVTEFYSLTEGEELDSSEVTQVVRVELPASALTAAGLSVGPEISNMPVKADVALGHDGLALAVRFVR